MRPIHLFAAALLIATLFADGGTAQQSEHLRFAFVTHGGPGNPFWIAADVDGLAVTCPDPDAIRENVARARAAGIPVVLNTADPGAGTAIAAIASSDPRLSPLVLSFLTGLAGAL